MPSVSYKSDRVKHTAASAKSFTKIAAERAAEAEAAAHSRFGCACMSPLSNPKNPTILTPGRWRGLGMSVKPEFSKDSIYSNVVPSSATRTVTDDSDPEDIKVTTAPVRSNSIYYLYCGCQVQKTGTPATKPEPVVIHHMTSDVPEIPEVTEVKLTRKEQKALAAEAKKLRAEQDADLAASLAAMKAEAEIVPEPVVEEAKESDEDILASLLAMQAEMAKQIAKLSSRR